MSSLKGGIYQEGEDADADKSMDPAKRETACMASGANLFYYHKTYLHSFAATRISQHLGSWQQSVCPCLPGRFRYSGISGNSWFFSDRMVPKTKRQSYRFFCPAFSKSSAPSAGTSTLFLILLSPILLGFQAAVLRLFGVYRFYAERFRQYHFLFAQCHV